MSWTTEISLSNNALVLASVYSEFGFEAFVWNFLNDVWLWEPLYIVGTNNVEFWYTMSYTECTP
jgi:hypothetical protein